MSSTASSLPILQSTREPEPILGIDLGTTYSLAAMMTGEGPSLVRDDAGDARIPSAVAFLTDGRVLVGAEAQSRRIADPTHTAYSIKRLIGRTLEDLRKDLAYIPYQIVEREVQGGRKILHVRIGEKEYTPEELSAMILRDVVRRASARFGRNFQRAVVTVPAYFDESQRQATRDAGRLAGLDVLRIVNEPTAAALAYGLQTRGSGKIAVYDFGGGTFDCSILDLVGGVFRVLSTHGDTHLGGDDVDRELMNRFVNDLSVNLNEMDPEFKQKIRDEAERIKIELSQKESAIAKIDDDRIPGGSYTRTVDRKTFEEWISPLVDRTLASCRSALLDARLSPSDIGEVVLVGGSSRLPLVRRRVEQMFGRRPHMEINPDEVVAAGAAVQGSILAGQLKQVLLLDIAPLSLGIETMGGAVSRLIARNSTIPAQATERFTTFVDNQTGVEIHVVQGERELARDCRSLGRFKLAGIPPMPAGMPQIDVSFLIDANGMLQVTAREIRSGQQQSIEVSPSQGLSRDEVDAMIRESIALAKEDFANRKLVELQMKADSNLRHTAKALKEGADRLTAETRSQIESAVRQLELIKTGNDADQLQRTLDELDRVVQPLVELLMNRVVESELAGKRLHDA